MLHLPARSVIALGCLLLATCCASHAQPAPLTDAERARRDAESPLRWIKLHADAAASAPVLAPAKPVAPARAPAKTVANKVAPVASAVAARAATSPALASVATAPAAFASAASASAATPVKVEAAAPVLPAHEPPPQVEAAVPVPAPAATSQPAATPRADPQRDAEPDRAALPAAEPELVAIDQAEPHWDARVMQALRKGSVQLRFEVGTDGRLVRAEVASSSDAQLAAPALAAMRQWRFQPIAKARSARIEFGFDLDR